MLVRYKPFKDLVSFEEEMKNFFDMSWKPTVDVFEDENKITIEAEIPGMSQEDVEITIDSGILTLKGNKTINKEKKYLRTERYYGSFVRTFSLPKDISSENISASYDKGVLSISIPKVPKNAPKQIKIENFN
jgi:HSP20 family protein